MAAVQQGDARTPGGFDPQPNLTLNPDLKWLQFSGVTPALLVGALAFEEVQQRVSDIIHGRLLVGHALHNDLSVLMLSHPRKMIRDTSR